MKVTSFIDVLGLIVVAMIAIDIVTSKNSAANISAAANGFSSILKSAQGK
jgi:hypothetical protein